MVMPNERDRLLLMAMARAKRDSIAGQTSTDGMQTSIPDGMQTSPSDATDVSMWSNPIKDKQTWDEFNQSYDKQVQNKLLQSEQQSAGGEKTAGVFNAVNAGMMQGLKPFGMADWALRQVPIVGGTVADVAGVVPYLMSGMASGVVEPTAKLLGASEQGAQAMGETAGTIAPFVVPYLAKKFAPPMIRGVSKMLPDPLTLARDATGISGMSEAGVGALQRVVREQPSLTNKVPQAFQNVEKTKSSITNIIDKQLSPRIQKLTNEGNQLPTAYIEGKAIAYLKDNSARLNLPTGEGFNNYLQSAIDNFRKKYGQTINPSDMQGGKTATHQVANYGEDASNPISGEFNKAVANVFREELEKLDPTLKGINKKIFEKMAIAESQSRIGGKASTGTTPFMGLPFYIGVTRSIPVGEALGATRWISKKINSPSARLGRAGMYDKLQNFGLDRPPIDQPTFPVQVPPSIRGLLQEPFTSSENVVARDIPNPTFPPMAFLTQGRSLADIQNPNVMGQPFVPNPLVAGQPQSFILPDNLRMMPPSSYRMDPILLKLIQDLQK